MGRGRRPIGDRPMTATERSRRHRAQIRGEKPAAPKPQTTADATEAAALRAEAAALAKELTRAKARIAELEQGSPGEGGADVNVLREEMFDLKTVITAWQPAIKSRMGMMKHATFKLILSCLHPDSRMSASDEKLHRAFNAFNRREYMLCDEAELPTRNHRFTAEEMRWRRHWTRLQAEEAKMAKRAAKKSQGRPASRQIGRDR